MAVDVNIRETVRRRYATVADQAAQGGVRAGAQDRVGVRVLRSGRRLRRRGVRRRADGDERV